jgi:hypothetical protein
VMIALVVMMNLSGTGAFALPPTERKISWARESKGQKPAEVNLPKPPENKAQTTLIDMGVYAEDIYDLANAGKWDEVEMKFKQLKGIKVKNSDVIIAALDTAIKSKKRLEVMKQANQLTLIVTNLSAANNPAVPAEVAKLDYYGRELEIWGTVKDTNKLNVTVKEMRRTWDKVRPMIEERGGTDEAEKFEELIVQIEDAQTASDYKKLAQREMDEVDTLEKIFE